MAVIMGLWRALLKLKKVMERPFLLPDKFRYAQEFKGWVLGAKLDRQRAAAARRYGDAAIAAERLAVVAQTTAVGGLLRIMLPAYGVPLDLVAGLEAAIETSRLQEGELFDRIVRGLLTFIDLSEQTDEAEQRLMAYDTQDWTKMTFGKLIIDGVCYFVWMTAGVGLLSRWLCKIGLNPYWPAMSFALTFIVWLSALAWKLGQWAWVVPIVGGLIGWKFNHSKDIVRAMKEDAKQLSGLLDALFTDAEVLPAQLRDLLVALHNRAGTALQRLDSAHETAKKAHHSFSQTWGLLRFFLQLLGVGVIDLLSCIAQPFIWAWRKLVSWATARAAAGGEGAAAPQPPLPGVGGGNGGAGGAGAAAAAVQDV